MPRLSWELLESSYRGVRCHHARQTHPLHSEALLLCAWPECNEGTARAYIDVAIERSPSPFPSRIVRFDRQAAGDAEQPSFRWNVSCP